MKYTRKFFVSTLAALLLAGCQSQSSPVISADEAPAKQESQAIPLWSKLKAPFSREVIQVPAGTKMTVRLDQSVSTERNSSGDTFRAHLAQPLVVQGKTLAPAGSQVVGELTHVDDSDRVKGRAEMTLALRKLITNGKEYSLQTNSRTFRAQGTKKKDAAVIGGGAAAGALIGAVTGGKKGAAVGAGVGAGAGTGYVLATKGKELSLGPETPIAFTLSNPISLPVHPEGK